MGGTPTLLRGVRRWPITFGWLIVCGAMLAAAPDGAAQAKSLLATNAPAPRSSSSLPPLRPVLPDPKDLSNAIPPIVSLHDTNGPAPRENPPEEQAGLVTRLQARTKVEPAGPGRFTIGKVSLNQVERSVSFPSVINQERGLVEFLLVAPYGRTHESLLRTDAEPYQIHIAMLLLGAKGDPRSDLRPWSHLDGPIEKPEGDALGGDSIEVEVGWMDGGKPVSVPVEDLVVDSRDGKPITRGSWTYNGSLVRNGIFRAQVDGAIASVIHDPTALVNNPRVGADDDEIWGVNTNRVPPMNTPVEVKFRFKSETSKAGR